MTAPSYREVNEQGLKDFKNLMKELKEAKALASNKDGKVAFDEKSLKKVKHPGQLNKSGHPDQQHHLEEQ